MTIGNDNLQTLSLKDQATLANFYLFQIYSALEN
jgi:hypothetical protein